MSTRWHRRRMTMLTTLVGAVGLVWAAAAYGQPAATTPEHQAVLDAGKKVTDARTDLSKSTGAFTGMIAKKRQEFNKSPEILAALEAQKTALAAYAAAKATVLESMGAKPEYVAAVKVREQARQKLKKTKEDNAPADQLSAIAEACLADEAKVDKMENEAFEADAPTKDAKAAAAKASAEVAALRHKFEEDLKADADYTTAKTAMDTATTALKTAQTDLQDKIKAENVALAAARAAQQQQQQQQQNNNNNNQRRGRGGGGSFG